MSYKTALLSLVLLYVAVLIFAITACDKKPSTPKKEKVILVCGLNGDDRSTYQRDLVSSLNTRLSLGKLDTNITVISTANTVEENRGLSAAFADATTLGSGNNADVVVWGNAISFRNISGDRVYKFHLRLVRLDGKSEIIPQFIFNESASIPDTVLDQIINFTQSQ